RYPFAEQILTFYAVLLDPQEAACLEALESSFDPRGLAAHVAERVLPKIVAVTVAEGPNGLRAASAQRIEAGEPAGLVPPGARGRAAVIRGDLPRPGRRGTGARGARRRHRRDDAEDRHRLDLSAMRGTAAAHVLHGQRRGANHRTPLPHLLALRPELGLRAHD